MNPQREMVLLHDALLAWRWTCAKRGSITNARTWGEAELRHRQLATAAWCELVYRLHGGK